MHFFMHLIQHQGSQIFVKIQRFDSKKDFIFRYSSNLSRKKYIYLSYKSPTCGYHFQRLFRFPENKPKGLYIFFVGKEGLYWEMIKLENRGAYFGWENRGVSNKSTLTNTVFSYKSLPDRTLLSKVTRCSYIWCRFSI